MTVPGRQEVEQVSPPEGESSGHMYNAPATLAWRVQSRRAPEVRKKTNKKQTKKTVSISGPMKGHVSSKH